MGRLLQYAALGVLCAGTVSAHDARPIDGDERIAVILTRAERAYVLEQMRLFVASVETVVAGLAESDRGGAVDAAAARGLKRNINDPAFPPTLAPKLPAEWKQLGGAMRKGFDALSDAIGAGQDTSQSLTQLSEVMRNCVACHSTYHIVAADE